MHFIEKKELLTHLKKRKLSFFLKDHKFFLSACYTLGSEDFHQIDKKLVIFDAIIDDFDFSDYSLESAVFKHVIFNRCTFGKSTSLKNTDFSKSKFSQCTFFKSVFKNTNLCEVTIEKCLIPCAIWKTNLIFDLNIGYSFLGANVFIDINLSVCSGFFNTSFINSIFKEVDFKSLPLLNVNFKNTQIENSIFRSCYLTDINFSYSTIVSTSFFRSKILRVNFSNIKAKNINFSYASVDPEKKTVFSSSALDNIDFSNVNGMSIKINNLQENVNIIERNDFIFSFINASCRRIILSKKDKMIFTKDFQL